jgi:pilus assembly protein TadC
MTTAPIDVLEFVLGALVIFGLGFIGTYYTVKAWRRWSVDYIDRQLARFLNNRPEDVRGSEYSGGNLGK